MPRLTLNRILCENQQERGSDEVYFVIQDNGSDSETRTPTFTSMDDEGRGDRGDQVNIGRTFSFTESVDVELWEEDPGNPDDLIDTAELSLAGSHDEPFVDRGGRTEDENPDGVRYVLNYEITV